MTRSEMEMRPRAVENVIKSEIYFELSWKVHNSLITRHEFMAEVDELIQSEIGYLNSEEYLREQSRESHGDDRRAG